MINATFSITTNVVSNQIFNGLLTFENDITNFDAADITLRAVDGNGITGVAVTVSQQTPSTYSLNFTLPSDVEGAFSVEATGMVLPDGESVEVAINATPAAPVVAYDTSVAVVATWGTPDYTVGDAQVAIPITFAADVVVSDVAVFDFIPVAPLVDDNLQGLQAAINGDGTGWTLTIQLPLDIQGNIDIDIQGEVFKVSTMVYDTVTIPALRLAVNTLIPEVTRREQEGTYTHGEIYDIVWQFNTAIQFYEPTAFYGDPNATWADHFVFSGADLGQQNIYAYIGTGFPADPLSLPEMLPTTEWEQLSAATDARAVFLMRYPSVNTNAEGASLVEVKEGTYENPGV